MEMVDNRKALELSFELINAETQLLYSSDYPHWDMDLPSTIHGLSFLSEQAKRNILGENARRLFNLTPVYSEIKLARRAFSPSMLRLACSERNDRPWMVDGRSMSQCG